MITRTLWIPGQTWRESNAFGDYCLLKNTASVDKKIETVKTKVAASSK